MDELLATGSRTVPPEWIDYNGHMMDAYYFLAFTEATESFLDHVGLGAAYRASTGSGIYTAEGHLCFLAGVTGGAALSYQTQLLGSRRQTAARVPPDDQRRPPGRDLRADVPARQRWSCDADAARCGRCGNRAGGRPGGPPPSRSGRPPRRDSAAIAGPRGINPPGLWVIGTGWPVLSGVGVGRGCRGVGRPADDGAEVGGVLTVVPGVGS